MYTIYITNKVKNCNFIIIQNISELIRQQIETSK